MGWRCNGEDLVRVAFGPQWLPVVAPRWALDFLVAEGGPGYYDVRDFFGGDHLHAVVRRGLELAEITAAAEADVPAGFVSQR